MNDDDARYIPGDDIIAAERAVVGSAVESASAAEALSASGLRAESFHDGRHALIFAAALRLACDGEPVSPVSVLHELTRTGNLERAGGGVYLHQCYASAAADPAWYARVVAGDWQRRNLLIAAVSVADRASKPTFDPGTDIEHARKLIEDAAIPVTGSRLRTMQELLADVVDGLERDTERGLTTGYRDLDLAIGGLAPGQVILIAARPGVGKSVILANITAHVAIRSGRTALLSSLEMSAEEITLRLISAEAQVNLHALTSRLLNERDWDKIARASGRISAAPLVIDDTPDCTLAHLRSQVRRLKPELLAVDYLQLLGTDKAENRQVAVAGLSRGLKLIAREFGIPVLVATQLNRQPEHRADKRPVMSDLRESGALEMDADTIILLHREDAYSRESPRAGEIDLIVDKQRQGPQCVIAAAFQGHYARIVDMAPAWSKPPEDTA